MYISTNDGYVSKHQCFKLYAEIFLHRAVSAASVYSRVRDYRDNILFLVGDICCIDRKIIVVS